MTKITAANLVHAINRLPKDTFYNYPHKSTKTQIRVVGVVSPEGPITVSRKIFKRTGGSKIEMDSISISMLQRLAHAITPNMPINIDRVFGGSYNIRSGLEALLAHTEEFYMCHLKRIQDTGETTKIVKGHKHLLWRPSKPHELGKSVWQEVDMVISEQYNAVAYDSLQLPASTIDDEISPEIARRHAQIQLALIRIGAQLKYRTWIAANDHSISYGEKKFIEQDGVIKNLEDESLMKYDPEAVKAARLIDCIWYRNGKLMPAVMEIEHSTGIKSGLTRMNQFRSNFLALEDIWWTIVAPDDLRHKVLEFANLVQFKPLKTKYLSYSSVEELFYLCEKRKIEGVTERFLDSFFETCVA